MARFDFGRTFLMGIGMQKAGTTWLSEQLAAHPSVHVRTKELHYWDRIRAPYRDEHGVRRILRARGGTVERLARALRQRTGPAMNDMFAADPYDHSGYIAYLRHGYAGQTVLHECSPNYALLAPGVFEEIRSLHDDMRFVLLLRDPVDRLWSGLKQSYRMQLRHGMDPNSLLRRFCEVLADPDDPNHRKSRYDHILAQPVTQSDACHIAFFDTLFSQDGYDAICRFAGLESHPVTTLDAVNPGRKGTGALPEEDVARAVEVFAPSYAAVRARFGAKVPESWRA